MPSLRRKSTRSRYKSPLDWPHWTDSYRLELGPDPDDAAWWATQNATFDSEDRVPDEVLDAQAEEASFQDRTERGLTF